MKAYLITTGVIFALVTGAHIWRIIAEAPRFASDPWYLALTVATAGLALWAVRLLWLSGRCPSS